LKNKLDELGIFVEIEDDPCEVELYMPVDLFSRYYMDDEIIKIKVRSDGFLIYLKYNANIIRCEEIINTLPLKHFLKLMSDFNYLRQTMRFTGYSRKSFILMDIEKPQDKTKYDLSIDYNNYHFG